MKLSLKNLISCVTAAFVLGATTASACSTFVLHDSKNTIFAHHMDERADADGSVFINKRGTARTSITWNQLVTGKPEKNIQWVSKWGSMTVGMNGVGMPDSGMNEKGLYISEMSLINSSSPTENRTKIFAPVWMQYVLDNFDSVEQVIKSIDQLSIDGMEWHYLVADAKGNRAVIELIEGKLVVHKNELMSAPLVCNDPYEKENQQFKTLVSNPNQSPANFDRFSKGAWTIKSTDAQGVNLERALSVLESLKQSHTRWTHIFDFANKKMYIKTSVNTELRSFDWSGVEFNKGGTLFADLHRVKSIEDFKPVTKEKHRDAALKGTNNLFRWIGEDVFDKYFTSIGGSIETYKNQVMATDRWTDPK